MCFCSTAEEAYYNSLKYKDSKFICSQNNKIYSKFSADDERANLISKDKFDCKILFCTKVLDNGINIKDRNLRHIIIDMLDPVTLIQCLGRKRILDKDDNINLYIKNYDSRKLAIASTNLAKKIELANELIYLGKDSFLKKYKKITLDDIIDNDMTFNRAKYFCYKYYQNLYYQLKCDEDNLGYAKYICKQLGKNPNEFIYFEQNLENKNFLNLLNENLNVRLMGEQKETFKNDFFNCIILPKKTDYRKKGLGSANSILKEIGLNYNIKSMVSTDSERKKFRYWIVERGN